MALQQWQVQPYQQAAIEMCYRIGVNPHESTDCTTEGSPPRWLEYAVRMAEHDAMVQVMRKFGWLV